MLAVFIFTSFLPMIVAMPSQAWMAQNISDAARIYGSGGFDEVLAFRLHELPGLLPLHVAIFPRTLALMLIGAALWRAGVFRTGSRARRYLLPAAAIGIVAGGVLSAAHANAWLRLDWPAELALERLATVLLAGGYGAAIVLATDRPVGRKLLAWAAPVGRMAFTNYLLQSAIFGWLFYGYGLGLFGKLGVGAALAIGIGVYILEAAFSAWWLKRYLYGPVEWLWRSAMYGNGSPSCAPPHEQRRRTPLALAASHHLFLRLDRKVLAALGVIPWVFAGTSRTGAAMPRLSRVIPGIGP
jgi:uncharacterized protein